MDGSVFNIQRFSIHDGPGIRTTVFLKGCTLHCFWCHNPESVRLKPELQFYPERCVACGNCVEACPTGAQLLENGERILLRDQCDVCGKCVDVCYSQALTIAGKTMSVEQVMADVLRDVEFYKATKGGVTLSGGEPVMQAKFSHEILVESHRHGIHTVVETAANSSWEDLSLVLSETDYILLDVKLMDSPRHRAATGSGNERIIANIRKMDELGIPILPRVPVVPGVNANAEDIQAIAEFAGSLKHAEQLILLPFHRLAEGKYRGLGLDYQASGLTAPTREEMAALAASAGGRGVEVKAA